MVDEARAALAPYSAELVRGDMRALRFSSGPFDAAVEVSGVISELPSDEAFLAMLDSVAACLRRGGVFLLALSCLDERSPHVAEFAATTGPVRLASGALATLRYEVLRHDPLERTIEMRRSVSVVGPGEGVHFHDIYRLHTYSAPVIRELLRRSRRYWLVSTLHLDTCNTLDPEGDFGNGEVLLALQRQ
jgi:hypothetical protein